MRGGSVVTLEDEVVGPEVGGATFMLGRSGVQRNLQGLRDVACDFILNLEDVENAPVIGLGPNVSTAFGFNQLRRDAQLVAGFSDASLQQMAHAQFHTNRPNVFVLSPELKRRCSRDHLEVAGTCKLVDQLF